MSRVCHETCSGARRATKVVAGPGMPRSATTQVGTLAASLETRPKALLARARFPANPEGRGWAGSLLCRAAWLRGRPRRVEQGPLRGCDPEAGCGGPGAAACHPLRCRIPFGGSLATLRGATATSATLRACRSADPPARPCGTKSEVPLC
jgi:hypothetical protein